MSTETKTFETIQHLQAALPGLPDGAVVHDRDGDRVSRGEVPGMRGVYAPYTVTYETADTTPAPLDSSKVKAGDVVTVRVEPNPELPPFDITGPAYLTSGNWMYVGGWPLSENRVTLTAHQPAPEPLPEWKPGTTGTATLNNLVSGNAALNMRVMRFANRYGSLGFTTVTGLSILDSATTWSISDFVPDEPRPLPTREQRAQVVDLLIAFSNDRADEWDTADKILALLRGESR